MIEIRINEGDAGQRSDKYLIRLLPGASKSLIYKQIRKKNITLNGKKMDGREKLVAGDKMQLFFSEETYKKFLSATNDDELKNICAIATKAYGQLNGIDIIYEDNNIILMNKPAGVLSQSVAGNEPSLNEWLIGYLLSNGFIDIDSISHFKPSVLNRLDRNTSGIVIGSKSLLGAMTISEMLKERTLDKYYLAYVLGELNGNGRLEGYHVKDNLVNKVLIKEKLDENDNPDEYDRVITEYKSIKSFNHDRLSFVSLLEVKLVTGKSHQIRAHLASIEHPIIGDIKYGNKKHDKALFSLHINNQLLHAYKLIFSDKMPEGMDNLSGKCFECKMPDSWSIVDGYMEK